MSLARRGASASASAIARRVANSPVVPPPGVGLPAAAADATAKTKNGGAKASAAVAAVVAGSGKRRLQRQQTIVRASPPPPLCPTGIRTGSYPPRGRWRARRSRAWSISSGRCRRQEERRTTTTAKTTSDEDEDEDDNDGDGIASSAYGWSITPLDPSGLCAISDYAIGGAVAGAVFRGSAVRTRLGARGISSAVGGGRPFLSGILPGAVLGLSAGIAIVALDRARILLDERFGVRPDPRRGVVDDD